MLFFKGIVDYKIEICGNNSSDCHVTILDANRTPVAQSDLCLGQINISNAIPWWPIKSGKQKIAYLYTFQVSTDVFVVLIIFKCIKMYCINNITYT